LKEGREISVKKKRKEFYFPENFDETLEEFEKIAKREGRTVSNLIRQLIRDYVRRHGPGNPQRMLDFFMGKRPAGKVLHSTCKHASWHENAHGPIPRPVCRLKRHAFVGMDYDLCDKCSEWEAK